MDNYHNKLIGIYIYIQKFLQVIYNGTWKYSLCDLIDIYKNTQMTRWSYSLIFYRYLQIIQPFVGDNLGFWGDKWIQDQEIFLVFFVITWSQLTGMIIMEKLSGIYIKILTLYKKSHLWAISFTIMVWSYRNYHKQCGNLMITWSFAIMSAC